VLTEAGILAVTAVKNFLVKSFIKKGLNGKLVKHVNKSVENVYLYIRVFTYIVSIVSQSAYIVKTAVITITSNSTLKALKVSFTILINRGGV